MRTRTLSSIVLAGFVLVACDSLPRRDRTGASGETAWEIDWGDDDGEFEKEAVVSTLAIDDPIAGDVQLQPVTNLTTGYLTGFDVRPDGKQLLLSLLEGLDTGRPYANIWSVDVGSELDRKTLDFKTRVTDGQHLDLTPTYIPQSEAILFSSNRVGATYSIFRKQMHGGAGVQMMTNPPESAWDFQPQVQGEGQGMTMLFTQVRPGSGANGILWTRPVEGGAPTQVGEGFEARWSNDGKSLLYSAKNVSTDKWHIWTRSLDGGQPTQLTTGDFNDVSPCWSPDGKKIVFASDRATNAEGEHNYDIWVMNSDGTDVPRQLTANESMDNNPRWLDKETIIFRSNRGKAWNIWSLKISQTDAG